MIRNFIKVAFRSLIRQKFYSAINVLGLAISISTCMLILLYVRNEMSYDSFFPKGDRIYKVALERIYPEHRTFYALIPHSFVPAMKKDFPEVENALVVQGPIGNVMVSYRYGATEMKSFEEGHFLVSDSTFFDFFDLELVKGDRNTMLSKPKQVMITESTALRYFGMDDPIGKVLNTDAGDFTVAGVCKDLPDNTHLQFDFVGSIETFPSFQRENFTSYYSHAYIMIKSGADPKALEAKFPQMVNRYAAAQFERESGQSWSDYIKAGNGYRYFLQPLASIHLDPTHLEYSISPGGNRDYVFILALIVGSILVIACINFMNLSTARSAERAREVGIRKTLGSAKPTLIYQFLTESVIVSLMATAVSIIMTKLLLPFFNQVAQKQLILSYDFQSIFLLVTFTVFVGCLAGVYPAFALSAFNPVKVMKGSFSGSTDGVWLRNGLVVFQFTISILLIVGTLVVGEQMLYIQAKKLGFDKDHVLVVERFSRLRDKTKIFQDEIRQLPGVVNAGATSGLGKEVYFFGVQLQPEGSKELVSMRLMAADDHLAQTVNLELKEGKFFADGTIDSLSVLLNETAVKALGLNNPIGTHLRGEARGDGTSRVFTVIGVLKNFNFQPLREEVKPLVIFSTELMGKRLLAVKINAANMQETIRQIEAKWKLMMPEQPFIYNFLDEQLKAYYAEEQRSGKLFSVFSALAIFIACVGLFGLSAYVTSIRTKEIGVRKVFGASVTRLTILLSKDFTKLVAIAFVLAVPLSWWMMEKWLAQFAFRIPITLGSFLLAGAIALGIAWLTVSYQSIKAALVNPIKSLRGE